MQALQCGCPACACKDSFAASANGSAQNSNFQFNNGHLSIDIEKRHVLVDERRVKLTPIEFRLLVYLAI